jgi:hypothetical protein
LSNPLKAIVIKIIKATLKSTMMIMANSSGKLKAAAMKIIRGISQTLMSVLIINKRLILMIKRMMMMMREYGTKKMWRNKMMSSSSSSSKM